MRLFSFLHQPESEVTVNAYLYLQSITEETANINRLIHCTEYSQCLQMPVQPSANPHLSSVALTKVVDQYTPKLNLAAATYMVFPTAILYFHNNKTKKIHYMVTLQDVFISSTKQYLNKQLFDTFTLCFSLIKWEYNSSSAGWDTSGKKPL